MLAFIGNDRSIQAKGALFLCDDNGILIISDIDDTIKVTGVTSVRAVLRYIFSGKYQSIIGLSECYRHYESFYNATSHYLTTLSDQLYPFLREFFQREQFSVGSYHMRHLTWSDMICVHLLQNRTRSRKFISFGNIFRKDPEIDADIYKQYSPTIIKIFICVSNKTISHRLNQLFQHISKHKWGILVNGLDLPKQIF